MAQHRLGRRRQPVDEPASARARPPRPTWPDSRSLVGATGVALAALAATRLLEDRTARAAPVRYE
jgi:hypothetical protein